MEFKSNGVVQKKQEKIMWNDGKRDKENKRERQRGKEREREREREK